MFLVSLSNFTRKIHMTAFREDVIPSVSRQKASLTVYKAISRRVDRPATLGANHHSGSSKGERVM